MHCDKDRKELESFASGSRVPIGSKMDSAARKLIEAIHKRRYTDGKETAFDIDVYVCPGAGCMRASVFQTFHDDTEVLLYPRVPNRGVNLEDVPSSMRKDYSEAVAIIDDSPNASAALSRRVLQAMLIKKGAEAKTLELQIKEMESEFPSRLKSYIDKIRTVGNLAAHAREDKSTAEIVDVDQREAEWLTILIEGLFDHYYTGPAADKAKLEAVEEKHNNTQRLRPQMENIDGS